MSNENDPVGSLTGKTVIVTGASSGIGRSAAIEFARLGARVALVGRDAARLEDALTAVRATAGGGTEPAAFRADFAVLDEVRNLADELSKAYPAIDVLCNNAGGVFPTRITTVDGHELTMQANHLGPFLLTNLLRDRLFGGRVVNTSSAAHRLGSLDPDDLSGARVRYRPFAAYGASKQANILFAAEAARRWPDILSTSYHPGAVRTRFGRDSRLVSWGYRVAFFMLTPEQGADTMVFLAGADASRLRNGGYYSRRAPREPVPRAADPAVAARLWEVSAAAVGLT